MELFKHGANLYARKVGELLLYNNFDVEAIRGEVNCVKHSIELIPEGTSEMPKKQGLLKK